VGGDDPAGDLLGLVLCIDLPPADDAVAINRVELAYIGAPTSLVGGDQGRAAATEEVEDDRLGCNYADVTDTIREFMRRGVIIKTVINGMTFDGATRDPMQQAVRDALIGFMAAMA
jgi:hypothetical protein